MAIVKGGRGGAVRGLSIMVSTGMKVVQDQDERYVSDIEALESLERGGRSCQSVRRQERMTVRLQPGSRCCSCPPRESEIPSADQHREAASVTRRRTSQPLPSVPLSAEPAACLSWTHAHSLPPYTSSETPRRPHRRHLPRFLRQFSDITTRTSHSMGICASCLGGRVDEDVSVTHVRIRALSLS